MAELNSNTLLYLAAVEQEINSLTYAYLNGEFEPLERGLDCYLVAEEETGEVVDPENSVRSTANVYLDGDFYAGAGSTSSSLGVYMDAEGQSVFVRAYITTSGGGLASVDSYIQGTDDSGLKEAVRFRSSLQQYIQISDSTQYDYLSEFTLNLFVRPHNDSDGQYRGIFIKEGVIETWVHPSGNSFGMRANIGGVWYQALTLSFTKGLWHMLTIKHDGAGIHFYMNGVEFYGVNAPGELTSNNAPIYFGRYPTKGTYSDIDMCDVQLWNYDVDSAEIAAWYKPGARRSCQHAYLVAPELTTATGVKRSYISSDSTSGNPFVITSSQPAGFAEANSYGTQMAYLVAGGETTTTFDTRFITDPLTRKTWDTIIMVRGNQTRVNEIQLGAITYPITRQARKRIRIPTSYDPLTITSRLDVWMKSYYDITDQRDCFINTQLYAQSRKSMYLHGSFTPVTESQGCFITSSAAESVTSAYIAGIHVFKWSYTKSLYLNSFMDFETDSLNAMIAGKTAASSLVRAYIPAPVGTSRMRSAFIMSTKDDIDSERSAFIQGNVGVIRSRNAYVYGHFSDAASVSAYLVAIPIISSGVECFIQSETPHKATQRAVVRGYASMSTAQSLYLKAEVNERESKAAYMAGLGTSRRATYLFINGPGTTSVTDSQGCFLSNGLPTAVKYAFIVSAPQSTQSCYIISSGSSSRVKSAYIEA